MQLKGPRCVSGTAQVVDSFASLRILFCNTHSHLSAIINRDGILYVVGLACWMAGGRAAASNSGEEDK